MQQHQPSQPSDTLTSQTIVRVMRLRDDPVPPTSTPTPQPTQPSAQQQPAPPTATTTTTTTTTTTRKSRKRKAPPTTAATPPQQQHPLPLPPPGMHLGHMLLPPHALVPPGMPPPPHIYQYTPPEYTQPPPPHSQDDQQQAINGDGDQSGQSSPKTGPGGRQLSQSKRAEQNRKAQRAFRERRDQHVKTLESRSQLLETALASADEANRRWEECRTLVDQLRIENTALRAALSQAQIQLGQISQASQQQQQHQPQPRDCKEEKTETPTTKSDG